MNFSSIPISNTDRNKREREDSGHLAIMVIAPGMMQPDENKGNIHVTRRFSSCHIEGAGHFKVKLKQNQNFGGRNDDNESTGSKLKRS